MIDLLKFKIEEPYKFEPVTPLEFYTYLEDIKQQLKKKMPEWHVNQINLNCYPATIYYHCCQWDFTKGKSKRKPLTVAEHIFAYVREEEHFLFNKHPISQNEEGAK